MTSTPSAGLGHNSGALFTELGPIAYIAVTAITPDKNNPRGHPEKQITKLAALISELGFRVPILIDENRQIISGEARWLAAKQLGMDRIPTIQITDLTKAQKIALALADNKLPELAVYDQKKLAEQFRIIIDADEFAVDLSGFETAEIDVILEAAATGGQPAMEPDADDDYPDVEKAISQTGDIWTMGRHRLICGSSRNAMTWQRLMDGKSAAMIFTDPPYNVPVNGHVSGTGRFKEFAEGVGEMSSGEFVDFLTSTIGLAVQHLEDGGIVDTCMDHRHMPELYNAFEKMSLGVLNLCVWDKGKGGMGSLYRSQHELILIGKKGKAPHRNNVQLGRHGRYRTNVWDYPGANSFGKTRAADLADHPTVKPTALVADAIRDVTNPNEIVIDAFMGSGTTLLAAERTNRIAYGVEIAGAYVDVAIKRWEKMTGGEAMLFATGETFDQVRARREREAIEPPTDAVDAKSTMTPPNIRRRERPLAA